MRAGSSSCASSGLCAETQTVCTDATCLARETACSLTGPHVWQTLGSQSLELDTN